MILEESFGKSTDFISDGMNAFERNVKRIGDCLLAFIALVVFSPLFLICYIAVRREDGGPAIFKQERIGRFGRPFNIYKFRSMRLDAERFGPALYKGGPDPRMTRVGKFLREHHLSNYEKVNLDGERSGREIIAPCEVDYHLLLKGNCIGCLTAMYDSALTGKIFFKEIGHEDYVCWLSILKQGYKAQNTNTVTALYRVSDHSVSSNKLKAMRWQWNILRNEMDLPVYKAVYYFIHYAIRAFAKAMR